MQISEYLQKECIKVKLTSEKKDGIIEELLDLIVAHNPAIIKQEALTALLERENVQTTGIGKGVAIPHAGVKSCPDIKVAFGLLDEKNEFDALDNQPVRLVFVILSPQNNVNLQLRFLARVSRILKHKELKAAIIACQDASSILDIIKQYEANHF